MPQTYEKLDSFLENNTDEHQHLTFEVASDLYKAAKNSDAEPGLILNMQKIVFGCLMCSAVLAESSPTFHASTVPMGRFAIGS